MESLPDDVWHQILKIDTQAGRLDHVDLCSIAIVNSHFDQLTEDPALWATLLSSDFPLSFYSFEAPSKAHYRRTHQVERKFVHTNRWIELPSFLDYHERQYICAIQALRKQISEMLANVRLQLDLSGVTTGEDLDVFPLHEKQDTILPNAHQPNLKQARNINRYYQNKPSRRFDMSSRPKVIPNSKSYIPMNRPPHRSMPRKI